MVNSNTTGSTNTLLGPVKIDSGTNSLQCSPLPGPVCLEGQKDGQDLFRDFFVKWQCNADSGPLSAEDKLFNDLQENEHIVQVMEAEDLEKEYDLYVKHIKKASGYVSPINDAVTAAKILEELGYKTGKVKVHMWRGKLKVIFKGAPANRKIFRNGRYLLDDPKIIQLAIGPKGLARAVGKGGVITFVLAVSIEIMDFLISEEAKLSELVGTLATDIVKIGISSIAALAAGLAVGAATVIGTSAAVPLIVAIGVGILVGETLDYIDQETGATAALIKELRTVEDQVDYWYEYLESNPTEIMRLFGG